MITWTLDVLKDMLTALARQPGRKVLSCHSDVWAALREALPDAEPSTPADVFLGHTMLAQLLAVEVTLDPDAVPGYFRLTRHDNCDVDVEARTVSHGRCPVTADGIVQLAAATPEETADAADA